MKIYVFLAKILAKFHVSGGGETKEEGEMSTAEISINFTKNWRNFGKKRNFDDFLKKSPPVGKFRRKIVLFCFISAIFRRFCEKRFVPLTPKFERTR